MEKDLKEYRASLLAAEQKMQEEFDKTVLALSGGALGVTFAFIKDVIGQKPVTLPVLLFTAWISWGVSVSSILASFFFSQQALRKAIKQVDEGKIYKEYPGGMYDRVTGVLNFLGLVLFLVGVILAVIFVWKNWGG